MKFNYVIPYSQERTVLVYGSIYGVVEAENDEEAKEKVQNHIESEGISYYSEHDDIFTMDTCEDDENIEGEGEIVISHSSDWSIDESY